MTLRNFALHPTDKSGSGAELSFTVTAETYRYRSDLNGGDSKDGKQ
ncbi:MAG: type 4a pilus biogenesis protein PilO [Gammaproteobacteria bacterium]|nr:type 4a pilus biogenesis protein PilO [Gammaproteobacteria bacterium]